MIDPSGDFALPLLINPLITSAITKIAAIISIFSDTNHLQPTFAKTKRVSLPNVTPEMISKIGNSKSTEKKIVSHIAQHEEQKELEANSRSHRDYCDETTTPRINNPYDAEDNMAAAGKANNDIENKKVLPLITTNMDSKSFAKALYARAKNDELKTGIPAIFMTAQACAESGYGRNCPAKNNIFCIRNSNWITYASVDESIISYEHLLNSPTYAVAMQNLKANPNESIYQFATDIGKVYDHGNSNYAKNIQNVIGLLNKWGIN